MAFFCKSYENGLIWVFLYAEFISALKTQPKSIIFEKHAKNGKENIYHHYFLYFVIFSKSLKQKCLIPTESCFLDGKKPNIAKLVDINFLADNKKNCQAIGFAKMEGQMAFSANPMKMCLFGYFCMQNPFLHGKLRQNLWFLRNMQKVEKKIFVIIIFYFLFFSLKISSKNI